MISGSQIVEQDGINLYVEYTYDVESDFINLDKVFLIGSGIFSDINLLPLLDEMVIDMIEYDILDNMEK